MDPKRLDSQLNQVNNTAALDPLNLSDNFRRLKSKKSSLVYNELHSEAGSRSNASRGSNKILNNANIKAREK